MSWECYGYSICNCPCGNGKIYQEHKSDDWNRFREGTPIIDCDKCKNFFHIEKFSYTTCDGEYRSTYYCVENSYPAYTGSKPEGKYTNAFSNYDVDFLQYLIEQYSIDTLRGVLEVLNSCGTYSKIKDIDYGIMARKIICSYKKFFNTKRISTIIPKVEDAINKYFQFECRYDVLEKAKAEYENYIAQKKKHSIFLK